MCSVCASTCAFCDPMEPKPTTAMFTVSLGARWPRPSTRRGTIKGALAATMAPSRLCRRPRQTRGGSGLWFDMSTLLSRRCHLPCYRRNKFIQAARWEGEGLTLLGTLVGGHQDLDDLNAVIEGQQRLFLPRNARRSADPRSRSHMRPLRSQPPASSPFSAFCFSIRSSRPCPAPRAKEKLQSAIERVPRHRVLGPSSSAHKR